MKTKHRIAAAIIAQTFLLTSCMQHDPWAERSTRAGSGGISKQPGSFAKGHDYELYQPDVTQIARMRAQAAYTDDPSNPKTTHVTDVDVITYTEHVKGILRSKFANARFARYASDITQIGLIAATGVAGITGAGAAVIGSLTLSTTVPPRLADVFHASNRAQAYQQAAANIEQAEAQYYAAVAEKGEDVPSSTKLTAAGSNLYKNVAIQIEGAEAVIAGSLPAVMAALPQPSPNPTP